MTLGKMMNAAASLVAASFVVVALSACSSDSNSSSASGNGGNGSGCNFSVTDNEWSYKYGLFKEVYRWVDETTVKHESWSGSYHLDNDDETLTDLNREEFYDKIMKECEENIEATEVEGGHFI